MSRAVSGYLRQHHLALVAIFLALGGTAAALPGKNKVDSGDIKNGQVQSIDVLDDGLSGADIAESTLSGIAPSGPAGGALAGSYPNPSLAPASVGENEIANGSVGVAEIASNAVGADAIQPGSVGASEIGLDAVGTGTIQTGAVTTAKLAGGPAVRAQSPSEAFNNDQTLNAGDVPEPLQFDEEIYDTDDMHTSGSYDVEGSKFTAPLSGRYEVSAGVIFSDPGSNYGTKRQLFTTRDPSPTPGDEQYIAGEIVTPQNPGATVMNVSGVTTLSAGDVVQAWVSHNATSNLVTVSSQAGLIGDGRHFLSMTWLGP
jgi:hypothetical protein